MPSLAGVDQHDPFPAASGKSALSHPKKYGFIISNPPYGERTGEKKNLAGICIQRSVSVLRHLDAWSMYLITSYEDAEK